MRIRLGDADRERLGCEEWLHFDGTRLDVVEAIALDDHGLDPGRWNGMLRGTPRLDDDGQPLMVDGKPIHKVRPIVWQFVVWMALRRAGIEVPLADLNFDFAAMASAPDEVPDSPGKDEAAVVRSAPKRRRTPRT